MTVIHKPSDIKVGKLYKTLNKFYYETVLYLGCINGDTDEKFLVIVVCDENKYYIGRTFPSPSSDTSNLWEVGFEQQD